MRPGEPNYYDELGIVMAGLSIASMQAQDVTSAATFAEQSLAASNKSLSISPNNVNYWKTRTKIYFGFSDVDPKFVSASIEALEKAFSLSPKDPKIAYNLAVLYGRLGENTKAIEILKQTIALKPNYRDTYYALYVFYTEVKQPNLARSILEEYLQKVDPSDKDFQEKIKQ
jgi:tetratricopeptide (TPR) repeat protein